MIAYIGAFLAIPALFPHTTSAVQPVFLVSWALLPAAMLVFVTGLLDDFIGLTPRQKLLGETLSAILACLGGVQVHSVAGFSINGFLGVPLTILWVVGCTNSFNLIDGLDGLASGLGLLASLTILVAGILHHDAGLVAATAPLAGALLGFLLFNFNPASVFLGDCGSLFVGFLLACYAVIWSQKAATMLGVVAPLMALSVPLLDTVLSIVRRFLRLQSIFTADHDHIHHRLLHRGFSTRSAVLLLYAVSSLAAGFSLIQTTRKGGGEAPLILFCAMVWAGIQYLRYQEFGIVARWFRQNGLRTMVKSHVCMQHCEDSLQAAASAEECWCALKALAGEFGFHQFTLRMGECSYSENLDDLPANCHWMLRIPLSESEYVSFLRPFEFRREPAPIALLADLLHRTLSSKAAEFRARSTLPPLQKVAAMGAGGDCPLCGTAVDRNRIHKLASHESEWQ